LAYLAELSTCCDSGIENVVDPRAYAAKSQVADPDSPTFHQAMNGKFAEEYVKAMQLEVTTLVQQRLSTLALAVSSLLKASVSGITTSPAIRRTSHIPA
jgi:hypothetical protein